MFNFPSNPTVGQKFIAGITSWEWDGVSWVRSYHDTRDTLRIKTITSNTYTLTANDVNGVLLRFTSNDPVNLLIPNITTIPVNSSLMVSQEGNGVIILLGLDGVTVNSPETIFTNKQHSKITLIKTAPNIWELEGNLKENPEYLIYANKNIVVRGNSIIFVVEADDVDSETLYWTLEPLSENITDNDFLSPTNIVTVGGQVDVTNEVGSFSIEIAESDEFIEELGFKINLRLGSNVGPIVASSQVITILENYSLGVGEFSTGIATSGGLWIIGENENGNLGLNNYETPLYTTLVPTPGTIKCFSSSDLCSAIIKTDGTLWTSGINEDGQLGLGDTVFRSSFTRVGSDTNWKSVSCGSWHMIAQKTDGSLWAWGGSWTGALGLGDLNGELILVPTRIGDDTNWKEYITGWHTIAIKTDGTLWSWGIDFAGTTGHGINSEIWVPTQVGTDNTWRSLSKEECRETVGAIKNNGSLWIWGRNDRGQCGNGTQDNIEFPTLIDNGPWKMICINEYNSIGIKGDGSLWGWGDNTLGQLGLGYTNIDPVLSRTRIGTENDWSRLRSTGRTTTAIKKNGTTWTWGEAVSGPLSYLTNTILSPVEFTVPDFLPTRTEL